MFCHPYVNMPNVSLKIWYKIRPASKVLEYSVKKIIFYPHKFRVKPTFARILLHVNV